MQIIKDKQLIENNWYFVADETVCNGDIVIPLAQWQQIKAKLADHQGKIGIRINAGEDLEPIIPDLAQFDLIELNFPNFADGRLFSIAWLLRARYAYKGELRAVGSYMPDQIYYLSRVGVNAFSPENIEDLNAIIHYLNDFSINYQRSIN